MQLDSTQIAIRERGITDLMDLSLHVLRTHFVPFSLAFFVGAAPFMVLNHLLLYELADLDFSEGYASVEETPRLFGFLFFMGQLVFLESQIAGVLATKYLGEAVFFQSSKLTTMIKDVASMAGSLLWCQGVMRGVGLAFLLAWWGQESRAGLVLLTLLTLVMAVSRSLRPFLNEIILLERNPLRSSQKHMITIGRRSNLLHSPSTGDLFARFLGFSLVALALWYAVFYASLSFSGIFLNDWTPGAVYVKYVSPFAMWVIAWFYTVVRFLSYLDLRIRHEGWEVELRMRAEAARLAEKLH